MLILLMYLTPRSELASNISPSALFRYVEHVHPTLLIDEADSFVGASEEMRGILNSGHTRVAANVIRNVELNGEHLPRRFSVWAPKAIATIRDLADTLEDRSIVVQLQRKPKGAKVARLRKRDCPDFAMLRSKAARWAALGFDNVGFKLVDGRQYDFGGMDFVYVANYVVPKRAVLEQIARSRSVRQVVVREP
jgi:putative DNA primase/helicase